MTRAWLFRTVPKRPHAELRRDALGHGVEIQTLLAGLRVGQGLAAAQHRQAGDSGQAQTALDQLAAREATAREHLLEMLGVGEIAIVDGFSGLN